MSDDLEVLIGGSGLSVVMPSDVVVVAVDEDNDFEVLQSTGDDFEVTIKTVSAAALTIALYARLAVYIKNEPDVDEVVLRYVVTDTLSVPANLTGSQGSALSSATAETVFSLRKNDVEFGTATFAAAGTTGAFAGVGATLSAGDVVTIIAPAVQDATLANIALTLAINRVV